MDSINKNETVQNYRNLIVWQKAMELVTRVYVMTEKYPKEELYGLVNQTRRSAVSIPSNIAEGSRRGSSKDFRKFVLIAYGSGAELETQVEIAKRLPFGQKLDFSDIEGLLESVMKMLNVLTRRLLTTHD